MEVFIEQLKNELDSKTTTENGAASLSSTGSKLVDFFSKLASLRNENGNFYDYFSNSLEEDELMTIRALFYSRDIRGGQGERSNFRYALTKAIDKSSILRANISLIPFYGRWDDMFSLIGTEVEDEMFSLVASTYWDDVSKAKAGETSISLLGKWMPSVNTSSKNTRNLARYVLRRIGENNERDYRKNLSLLRSVIDVVERKISRGNFNDINFEHLPSLALKKYSSTFSNKSEEFPNFLREVEKGNKKLNSGTLYPYEITNKIHDFMLKPQEREYLELAWKSLPNYVSKEENSLVVVDVSGSMSATFDIPQPIDVAVSLGIYFAERNIGAFKDYFMTFSHSPKVLKLKGDTLFDRVKNLRTSEWGMNTNLQSIFSSMLKFAKENNVPESELPKKVYIISDMQFDVAMPDNSLTNFEAIKEKYVQSGYELPKVVFWNVKGRSDNPVAVDETGTFLVSGFSPSILKFLTTTSSLNPKEFVLEILQSERYSRIN